MGISSATPHRAFQSAGDAGPGGGATVAIPASDDDFRAFVSDAGYVDVVLHVDEGAALERAYFTLSTNPDPVTTAHLYSNRRPEIRSFLTISSLRSALQRFGVEIAELPVVPGSGRCYVHKKGVPTDAHSARVQPGVCCRTVLNPTLSR